MRISDWSSDVCSSDLSGVDYPNIVAFLIVGPNGKFVLQGIVPDKLGRGEELEHQVNHASIFFAPRKVVSEVEIKDSFASLNRELCNGCSRHIAVSIEDIDYSNGCRLEEHTSEIQSLMRLSYAVFCLKKKI